MGKHMNSLLCLQLAYFCATSRGCLLIGSQYESDPQMSVMQLAHAPKALTSCVFALQCLPKHWFFLCEL